MIVKQFKISEAPDEEIFLDGTVTDPDFTKLIAITGKAFIVVPRAERDSDGSWKVSLHLRPVDQYISVAVPSEEPQP